MLKTMIFLFTLIYYSLCCGQISVGGGGTGGGGPDWAKENIRVIQYRKLSSDLIESFAKSWEATGRGKAPFKGLVELNNILVLKEDTLRAECAKACCTSKCIFTDEVKAALKIFNNASLMTSFIMYEFDIQKIQAEKIVKAFKSYE